MHPGAGSSGGRSRPASSSRLVVWGRPACQSRRGRGCHEREGRGPQHIPRAIPAFVAWTQCRLLLLLSCRRREPTEIPGHELHLIVRRRGEIHIAHGRHATLGDEHEVRPRRHGPHRGVAIAWTREQHHISQRRCSPYRHDLPHGGESIRLRGAVRDQVARLPLPQRVDVVPTFALPRRSRTYLTDRARSS